MTAPERTLTEMVAALDYLDFPTAWAIQNAGVEHQPNCSSVPGWHPLSGPGLLCDCGAVKARWRELRGAS